ncbi:formylglycine-generating enzyme family protein [Microcoleus sp. B3-A4]|uniref:formylglycine-generating enzyme family protein n=1 Tax=Microcoleus sp. B3-A4 TaxID=2818653 RepID=UPI002FD1C72A
MNYREDYSYRNGPQKLYPEQTTDVGSFPPNAFGLYDMHGNVWEWCSDRWHNSYNGAPTDGSSWETSSDNSRVQRGGSWFSSAVFCRSAYRSMNSVGYSLRDSGFRVAVASVSSPS